MTDDPVKSWWQLWLVPTARGKRAFNWTEKPLGKPFKATKDDAQLERYLHDCDDRAPDKDDYRRIELRAWRVIINGEG